MEIVICAAVTYCPTFNSQHQTKLHRSATNRFIVFGCHNLNLIWILPMGNMPHVHYAMFSEHCFAHPVPHAILNIPTYYYSFVNIFLAKFWRKPNSKKVDTRRAHAQMPNHYQRTAAQATIHIDSHKTLPAAPHTYTDTRHSTIAFSSWINIVVPLHTLQFTTIYAIAVAFVTEFHFGHSDQIECAYTLYTCINGDDDYYYFHSLSVAQHSNSCHKPRLRSRIDVEQFVVARRLHWEFNFNLMAKRFHFARHPSGERNSHKKEMKSECGKQNERKRCKFIET